MKRAFLCAASLLAIASTSLHAQTIAGTWQGTLPIPQNPRVVLKIEKSADGSLHGGYIRIDLGPDGIPLTSVTFNAPNVSIAQMYADISYQGKLSADGKSIEGVWTQGKQSNPLTLTLATPDTLWRHEGPAPIPPMSATADPAFDVATIKPSRPEENAVRFDLRARQFKTQDTSAKELIKIAYNVRGRQVLGGPSWLEDIKFDVVAEPDTPGLPSEDQNRLMVKKLLLDRFHLAVHIDHQIFPVFAVTLDKNADTSTPAFHPSDPEFNGHGSVYVRQTPDGQMQLQFAGQTLPQFIGVIMNLFQDRQLVDETGLTGLYDVTLTVPAGVFQGAPTSGPEDERANAMIAAAQQLGFRFVSKKAPLAVVIVDHIDLPTPN